MHPGHQSNRATHDGAVGVPDIDHFVEPLTARRGDLTTANGLHDLVHRESVALKGDLRRQRM